MRVKQRWEKEENCPTIKCSILWKCLIYLGFLQLGSGVIHLCIFLGINEISVNIIIISTFLNSLITKYQHTFNNRISIKYNYKLNWFNYRWSNCEIKVKSINMTSDYSFLVLLINLIILWVIMILYSFFVIILWQLRFLL